MTSSTHMVDISTRSVNQTFYTANDDERGDESLLLNNQSGDVGQLLLPPLPEDNQTNDKLSNSPTTTTLQTAENSPLLSIPDENDGLDSPSKSSVAAGGGGGGGDNGSSNPDEFEIREIDHYELLEEVGRGAQGVVYKCRDRNTETIYAMKELKGMAGKLTSFLTELSIMMKLNHPNLTKLFQVYDAPHMSTSMYFVMDYVEGGPVMKDAEVLGRTAPPLAVDDAQAVFRQLMRALNYLHYNGVIHRDIKPSNILRDKKTGVVKLSDFGVASLTSESKAAKIIGEDDIVYVGTCGTPAFLSPEGLGGAHDHAYHGRPADVWAAGITLFVFLYGVLPFVDPAGDLGETMRRIMEEPLKFPTKPAGIPKSVKELLTRMLDKDPTTRATLSYISNHSWVDVGNWKKDSPVLEVEKPTLADTKAALSIPRMINRVRKSSSGMAKKISHVMSVRKDSTRRRSSNNNGTGSPRAGVGSKLLSSVGSGVEDVNHGVIGARYRGDSWKDEGKFSPPTPKQHALLLDKHGNTEKEEGGEEEETPIDQFMRALLENFCCLDRR